MGLEDSINDRLLRERAKVEKSQRQADADRKVFEQKKAVYRKMMCSSALKVEGAGIEGQGEANGLYSEMPASAVPPPAWTSKTQKRYRPTKLEGRAKAIRKEWNEYKGQTWYLQKEKLDGSPLKDNKKHWIVFEEKTDWSASGWKLVGPENTFPRIEKDGYGCYYFVESKDKNRPPLNGWNTAGHSAGYNTENKAPFVEF